MVLSKVLIRIVSFRDTVSIGVSHHSFWYERVVLTCSSSEICYIYILGRNLAQKPVFYLKVSDSDRGCLGVTLSFIVGRGDKSAVKHALLILLLLLLRILGAPNELVIEATIESRSFIYQTVRRFLFLSRAPSLRRLLLLLTAWISDWQL